MREFLLKSYSLAPVAIQNVIYSAWGVWARRQRFGREFHRRLEWLEQSQFASSQELDEYQHVQIRRTIQHAYRTVPFYADRMRRAGVRPEDIRTPEDLRFLPVLTKAEVREHQDELVSTVYRRRSLRLHLTSGTTGTPLRVYLTPEAEQFQWAVWWRHRSRFGLRLGDKFLTFGARLPVLRSGGNSPIWRRNRAFNQVYLSTYDLTPKTMESVVEWLNRERFDFFTGYPSAMYVLANFIREHGLEFRNPPRYIVTGSDALLPGFERVIRETFGTPVTDQYGSMEACGNLSRCELGKYHLDYEFGYLELLPVPGAGNPRVRRLVFTGFANPAMPFIRYDIGDYALLSDQECRCGRKSLVVDRIEGRTEDYVRTPDGRMAIGMNQVFEWAPGLREAQIRQDRIDEVRVLIVPSPSFGEADRKILEREMRRRLGDEIRIHYEMVKQIPRTRAGKFRAVISTLPPISPEEKEQQQAVHTGLFDV